MNVKIEYEKPEDNIIKDLTNDISKIEIKNTFEIVIESKSGIIEYINGKENIKEIIIQK